ncbi:hypothetical protein GALMADRAFT_148623 [Galerina marginata CBS 339.88]|uniref:Uncharacterized protein n=1 Tax=Galerina marginata (strain CBS 339.88) TaxID=685588 RepID=A0A067S408_GALM3|nr:hypothetical protein GALMADRAFT_148623 [Galerina marginata CBS 339.88]
MGNPRDASPGDDDAQLHPALDDLAGTAELASSSEDFAMAPASTWISISPVDGKGKKPRKGSVLRLYSNRLTSTDSKDRLKRVRGFPQYNEITTKIGGLDMATDNRSCEEEEDKLHILDPAMYCPCSMR